MGDSLVLLTTLPDLASAQLLQAELAAQDIQAFIPDENTLNSAFHLTIALGGIRLMVAAEDEALAREVIENSEAQTEGVDLDALAMADGEVQFGDPSRRTGGGASATLRSAAGQSARTQGETAERHARRALNAAILAILLPLPLLPYAMIVTARAYGRGDQTREGRRLVWASFAVCLLSLAEIGLVLDLVFG